MSSAGNKNRLPDEGTRARRMFYVGHPDRKGMFIFCRFRYKIWIDFLVRTSPVKNLEIFFCKVQATATAATAATATTTAAATAAKAATFRSAQNSSAR